MCVCAKNMRQMKNEKKRKKNEIRTFMCEFQKYFLWIN